ncbi:MAG: hypothetical protein ACLP7P_05545 [Rhodomicrobium sp.]
MKTASKPAITVDEFLAWSEGQERGRFELFGGEIVMQQSERIAHVSVKGNIYVALRNAIAQAGLKCPALMDGAAVQMPRIVSEGSLTLDPPGLTLQVSELFSG